MTNKPNKPNKPNLTNVPDLKTKIMEIRLSIKAHQEKNTNAHKATRKQIAQMLTKSNTTN